MVGKNVKFSAASLTAFIFLVFPFLSLTIYGQQTADPDFDAKVAVPAYTKKHPKLLFDEAHNNFHTSNGRYKPFADLLANDGYIIKPNKKNFSSQTLAGYDILLIANAMGGPDDSNKESNPAFTPKECDAVRDWVQAGGSLLLIADHAPFGAASEILARRFDIDMSKGYTIDSVNFDPESRNKSVLVFTNTLLAAEHPIMRGRNESEKISRIITFTGQSLKGPAGSTALLKLSDTAIDVLRPDDGNAAAGRRVSAAGRSQAIALNFGKGRVVVFGEAAMISAQIISDPGAQVEKMGMNVSGIDNRQFALNTMHWLSGLIGR